MKNSLPLPLPLPASRLSIAIVGAGAIGSTFAYHLALAGHDVTAIARPGSERLRQLRRDRGIVVKSGATAGLRVADRLDEQAAYDLVLVTVLAHQVDAVLPALRRSKAAAVQFMFTTVEPDRWSEAVGSGRCSFGMPFVMSTLDGDGRLDSTANPGQKTLHGDARWVALFAAADIPSAFEPRMALWLRCHAPVCIAMESICVAGQRRGGGASWREATVVARGLRAGFAIVRGLGHRPYPTSKSVLAASPVALLAGLLWLISKATSFRELLSRGLFESRALADVLAASASGATLVMPDAAARVRAMRPAMPDVAGSSSQDRPSLSP